jgi:hypothetical protein
MIVAGMCAAAVEAADVREVLAAGLAVVPLAGDYAQAVRRGADLGWSGAPVETALEALHAEFGGLQWVHAVNNRALTAFALARSDGDLTAGICTAQTDRWLGHPLDRSDGGIDLRCVEGALFRRRRN